MIQRIQTLYLVFTITSLLIITSGVTIFSFNSTESEEVELSVKVNVFGVQADADLSENVSEETQDQLKDFLELEERTMSVRSAPVFSFPFYLILIFMSLLAVATLLTFKKLKTQQRLGRLNFVFNLLATVFVVISFYIAKNQSATIIEDVAVTANLGFGFYCFIIATAFAFLAIIGIKRDLKLIESVDRIR